MIYFKGINIISILYKLTVKLLLLGFLCMCVFVVVIVAIGFFLIVCFGFLFVCLRHALTYIHTGLEFLPVPFLHPQAYDEPHLASNQILEAVIHFLAA